MRKSSLAMMLLAPLLAAADSVPAPYGAVRLSGPIGRRLDRMIERHVMATDAAELVRPFLAPTETHWWQTEFWGKYMHSACPFALYTGSAQLKAKVGESVRTLLAAQEPDGYLGNYRPEARFGDHWDVWGQKYTLMGLLHWYDLTGDGAALTAARRLCDLQIAKVGPKGKPLHTTGNYVGMPSCSVLEPVMWLYRRTGEKRYLDYAAYIVKEMDAEDGPRLLRDAEAGIDVVDRGAFIDEKRNRTKAYEMMSCYQGLLEYWQATGDRRCLAAAVATAENIAKTEINLAGGAAAAEHWFRGAVRQTANWARQQETCVTVTWMRLCGKLLEITGEPKWADRIERTFYNAYLAAMKPDGSEFAGYTPMNGVRGPGQDHCELHTDCCNSNGPRGFLVFLRDFLLADGDRVQLNFYASATAGIRVPKLGREAVFGVYTRYPVDEEVAIEFRSPAAMEFELDLRIPAWSRATSVTVNGTPVDAVRPGSYCAIRRRWQPGDRVALKLDLVVRADEIGDFMAYSRGPLLLARDARLSPGLALDEPLEECNGANAAFPPKFAVVRPASDDFLMNATATLPYTSRWYNPDGRRWSTVTFCDYASAGNAWRETDAMRVFLPLLIEPGTALSSSPPPRDPRGKN